MSEIDDLVKEWLLRKFLATDYDGKVHGPLEDLYIKDSQRGWECGCWSDYTRDDDYNLRATVGSHSKPGQEWVYDYGRYRDLPRFIQELDEYANGPTKADCVYADEGDE